MLNRLLLIVLLLSTTAVFAAGVPVCKDKKQNLEFNSDMLLRYRDHMEPKFKTRGFVKATLVKVMEDRQGHVHFEGDIDGDLTTSDDRIEIIYNVKFGALPDHRPGDTLIACGDFIVDPYSEHKAVLHWLHYSPKRGAHDDGYLSINGVTVGLRP